VLVSMDESWPLLSPILLPVGIPMRIIITRSPVWLLAFSLLVASAPTLAEEAKTADKTEQAVDLQVGDWAPEFEAFADSGKLWRSKDQADRWIRVVYFYPADFTSGCSKQAEQWRDNMHKLAQQCVEVLGISGDSIESHKLFKEHQQLNFTLLADTDGSVAKQFGVPISKGGRVLPRDADRKPLIDENGERVVLLRDITLARWTFVIDGSGRIIYKNTKVNPVQDSQQILDFLSGGSVTARAAASN
jgi:thioredoxin-dependent peroxiredoxin